MSRKAELKGVLNKSTKQVGLQQLRAAETRYDFSKALDCLDPRLLDNDLDSVLSICEDFLRTKWRLDGMESQVMNVMMLALINHKNQPQLCNKHLKKTFDQNPYLKKIAVLIKKKLPDFELAFPGSVAYNRAVIHAQLKKQGAGFDIVNELTVGRINWLDAVNYALDNKYSSMMARLMRLYVNSAQSDASLSQISDEEAQRLVAKAKAMGLATSDMEALVAQLPVNVIRYELRPDLSNDIASAAIHVLLKQIDATPALKKYSAQTMNSPQQRHQLFRLMQHLSSCQSNTEVDQILGHFRRHQSGLVRSWSIKDLKGLGLCAGVPLYGSAALAYNVSKRAGGAKAFVTGLFKKRQGRDAIALPVEPVVMATVADPGLVKAALVGRRVIPEAVLVGGTAAVVDPALVKTSMQAVAVPANTVKHKPVAAVQSAVVVAAPVSIEPTKIKALKWFAAHHLKSTKAFGGVVLAKDVCELKAQIAKWLPELCHLQKTIRYVHVDPVDEAINFSDLRGLVIDNIQAYRGALREAEQGVRVAMDAPAYNVVREQHLQAVSGAYAALLTLSVAADKLIGREAKPVSSATSMVAVGLHKQPVREAHASAEPVVVGVKVPTKKQAMFS